MYAIVDIETTGGHASANGITEIAIVLHNGYEVEGRYHTLINPLMPIPRYITSLTGIDNAMVATAPVFSDVAGTIYNLLKDRVFVAHSVNFDYSFIKHQLAHAGYDLDAKKLCTVRLSRKIFEGYRSYSLGNICRELGIEIENRHRASGDAEATARLFDMLIRSDKKGIMAAMLKHGSRERYLPMHLPASEIEKLPHRPGVYYFYNNKDVVIYVGKAKNLRKRVTSHFSNNSTSRRKQELVRNVYRIGYEECGSDFLASVFESIEIKRLWPVYNYSQKRWEHQFGLFSYEDRNGIIHLAIERKRKNFIPLYTFNLLTEGHTLLRQLMREFHLCPRYCFLQTSGRCVGIEENYCHGVCEGREDVESYNKRVSEALAHLKNNLPSFALVEPGRKPGEQCYVLLEDGKFYGMGYVETPPEIVEKDYLKKILTPYPGNELIRSMILRQAALYPEKMMHFTQR